MFGALSLSVAIVLLAGLAQLKAADPPDAPPPDAEKPRPAPEPGRVVENPADVFRSVRIVRDLAELNILSLRPQKTGAWIVARIRPGGLSGGLYLQGGSIEAETGEFVGNGVRPRYVIQIGGHWKRLELLSGEAPPEGRFQWKEPYVDGSFNRYLNIHDSYSVFSAKNNNGTVICQFFGERKGAEQFSKVTAIPDGWRTFVKPAYEYHVRHSAGFTDNDLDELREMATGENPFIALTAIRHILSRTTTVEDMDQLVDLLRTLPEFRQAVLTFWLLEKDDDDSRNVVLQAISRAGSAARLPGMALGMESWTAAHVRTSFLFDPGPIRDLRDKAVERWQSFDPSTAEEEPWKVWHKILVAPGIPKGKSTETNEKP